MMIRGGKHDVSTVKSDKPWKEKHQTMLTCGVLVAIGAALIYYVGVWVPYAPLPAQSLPHLSLQESRR